MIITLADKIHKSYELLKKSYEEVLLFCFVGIRYFAQSAVGRSHNLMICGLLMHRAGAAGAKLISANVAIGIHS